MRLVFSLLYRHVTAYPAMALGLLGTSLLTSALWVIEPLYSSYAIDQLMILGTGGDPNILRLAAVWGCILLVLSLTNAAQKYVEWWFALKVEIDVTEDAYIHALRLPIGFHTSQKTGEVMKTVQDGAYELSGTLGRQMLDMSMSLASATVFIGLSLWIEWRLATILLFVIALFIGIIVIGTIKMSARQDEANKLWIKPSGRMFDASTNIFNVKSAGAETRELAILQRMHGDAFTTQEFINRFWAIIESMNFFMLTRILIAALGVVLLVRGRLTLGELYFFQFSFYRVLTPFEMLGNMLPQWRRSIGKVRMMNEVLSHELEPGTRQRGSTMSSLKGAVTFDGVSFSYHQTHSKETENAQLNATIDQLSFTIRPGEHIALVGHSGAGKSTIAMLLNRFYEPTHGTILIDGSDISTLDVHWWREQIGLVLQESLMFNDTVLNNIRYARPDASIDDVKDAAQRSSADEFIARLPNGYETEVGERGIKLSGGERQRIAIARAILKKPSIVVLDEATSALDSITEAAVQKGIKELIAGRTAVIIAHRLSTVRAVDRIAVLENGKLIAFAPHEELLMTTPIYKEMVELQQGGVLAE